MAILSLREAARETGTSKSTILRAIQSGRLSAPRTDEGGYAIDPSELFRVYSPKPVVDQSAEGPAAQGAPTTDATELRIRNAGLDAEVRALRMLLEAEKQRLDDMKAERDRWAAQAERLALGPPVAPVERPRSWLPWRRSA